MRTWIGGVPALRAWGLWLGPLRVAMLGLLGFACRAVGSSLAARVSAACSSISRVRYELLGLHVGRAKRVLRAGPGVIQVSSRWLDVVRANGVRARARHDAVAAPRPRTLARLGREICAASVLCMLLPLTASAQDPAPAAPEPAEPAAAGGAPPGTETPVARSAAAAPAPAQATTPTAIAEDDDPPPEPTEPVLSLSAQLGVGYMSGGHGGLFAANRSPLALDVQVLTVREPRYLIGGALRIELEGAHAVAGIFRFQLRHPLGPIELRPGIGVPFYIAPRTMLGPEAGVWGRLTFSRDLALLAAFSASAFVMGDDVPKGNTVIMLQIFIGAELFI